MADKNEIRHESLEDKQAVIHYLKALREGFLKGRISFDTDERHMAMHPQGLIKFEMKVRKKSDQVKMALKIDWKEEQSKSKSNSELRINL